jgi:hypothetical protein
MAHDSVALRYSHSMTYERQPHIPWARATRTQATNTTTKATDNPKLIDWTPGEEQTEKQSTSLIKLARHTLSSFHSRRNKLGT